MLLGVRRERFRGVMTSTNILSSSLAFRMAGRLTMGTAGCGPHARATRTGTERDGGGKQPSLVAAVFISSGIRRHGACVAYSLACCPHFHSRAVEMPSRSMPACRSAKSTRE